MTDPELVFESDNGLISLALRAYIHLGYEMGGDQKLIDRAAELETIFKNKSKTERYE